MAILDIDMGNTRTKWRCGADAGTLPAPKLPEQSLRPDRVRVATVLRNMTAVAQTARARYGVEAEFAQVQTRHAGLVCGYREPARLGVDRWLATLAAWHVSHKALVVVCAGTAATVDFVSSEGRHQGGYIAPGLRLMREVLQQRTADVGSAGGAAGERRGTPGTDTPSAVRAGTAAMLLGYVESAIGDFCRRCEATVFVTGGDAGCLVEGLSMPVRHVPSLVLDGLAIALP